MDERQFFRQYRRFQEINTVLYNVVKMLKRLPFNEVWKRLRVLSKNDVNEYAKFFNELHKYMEAGTDDDIAEERFIYLLEDLSENSDVKILLNEASADMPDINTLQQEVSGTKKNVIVAMYDKSALFSYVFAAWCSCRLCLALVYNDLKSALSKNKTTESDLEQLFNKMHTIVELSQGKDTERIYVEKKNLYRDIKVAIKEKNIDKILMCWNRCYEQRLSTAENAILILYVILNTPIYSISQREEIVDYLRTTMFKYLLQQKYNIFKKKFPDVIDWKFCDYLPVSLELPEDAKTLSSIEDDCPHNYVKEMLGPSDSLKKQISKLGEGKYREVLEVLYNYLSGVETYNIGKKAKYIECNKIDFIYLLGGELFEGECTTDDPIIEWVEGTKTNMNGFFYALYGCSKGTAYDNLGKGTKKDCYCFRSNSTRERVNIKENRKKSIECMNQWINIFKKIGDKVVKDSISKK